MRTTQNYKLGYYETGDQTDPNVDFNRIKTIENQLFGLANIFGNGVISGWGLLAGQNKLVTINTGYGFVKYTFF